MVGDVVNLVFLALAHMPPLLLAAVGEIIAERAGVVNIGIEGVMLLSALAASVVAYNTGSPILGLLVGIVVGAVLGLLHALVGVVLRGDQIVAGVGVNMFAYGMAVIGLDMVWHTFGNSPSLPTVPKAVVFGQPVSPMVPVSVLVAVAAWYMLFKTTYGLKLRACGEEPRAAEAMGVNVVRTRVEATLLGAVLAGLAGAYLSVDWVGQFTKEITAGRGFIALGNVVFSNWNPLLAVVGGFVFGFFDALAVYLGITSGEPSLVYLFKTIPYLATLAVVTVFIGRARPPASLGKPYVKE